MEAGRVACLGNSVNEKFWALFISCASALLNEIGQKHRRSRAH